MATLREQIFFCLRLLTCLFLLSCLSPAPEAPAARPATFAALIGTLPGELRIVIWKSQYTLTLYKGGRPVKAYRAVFGRGYQNGDKERVGDKRTPEGKFYICTMNHSKRFYKFMGLSYPGIQHADEGLRQRLISPRQYESIRQANEERRQPPWDTRLGGAVGIHGRMEGSAIAPAGWTDPNWTDGCIALENDDVDEIFSVAALGTPVTILP
jgi:murein L,D-transpeptidase YafK